MDTRYLDGLRREAVAMRNKGMTPEKIAAALGVSYGFVEEAWAQRASETGRQWEPDYDDASETGGY